MVTFQVNLPIWRARVKAGVREAEFKQKSAEYAMQQKRLWLERHAQQTLYDLDDARRRRDLYADSLLPKAEQAYQSVQSSYAGGGDQVDLLDLLDSVRVLLDFQLERIRARRDIRLARAELEYLLGGAE